jgi:dCMP deaminase
MSRPSKDDYFLGLLPHLASRSHDQHTKTSCVIAAPDGEILTTGYNGLCRHIGDDEGRRLERPEKYFWMEHAERNAIYNAARRVLKGSTAYVAFYPCVECARGFVQSGISRVVVDRSFNEKYAGNPEKWEESFKRTNALLEEARVEIAW